MKISETVEDFLLAKQIEEGRAASTVKAYRYDFAFFVQAVGNLDVDCVTPLHVRQFLRVLADRHYTKKGLARKVAALRSFFSHLVFNDLIVKNPMDKIRSPQVRIEESLPKFLAESQMQRVLADTPGLKELGFRRRWRAALIIRLMYATLTRVGEICRVQLKDFDWTKGTLRVRGKGNKERYVPVDADTLTEVQQYLDRTHSSGDLDEYLFHNSGGHPISPRSIQLDLKMTKKLLGLPDSTKFTPHVMRHTGATHLRQRGMDLSELQDLLGHASPSTTRIYAKNDIATLKDHYSHLHPLAAQGKDRQNLGKNPSPLFF